MDGHDRRCSARLDSPRTEIEVLPAQEVALIKASEVLEQSSVEDGEAPSNDINIEWSFGGSISDVLLGIQESRRRRDPVRSQG